jgi:hypothetical protein
MDKFNQFLTLVHAGKYNINHRPDEVEVEDSSAFDQCMDLLFAYCDFLGIPRETVRHQYAYQIWQNQTDLMKKYFDIFPNTATFIPQTGDVALFGIINGIPVGHVDLVGIGSTINNLISYSQNWDTLHYYHIDIQGNHIPYCRTIVHTNYYGCVGFLRPKLQLSPDDQIIGKIRTIIDSATTSTDKRAQIKQIV